MDGVCERLRSGQNEEQVNMVRGSARNDELESFAFSDAAEKREELGHFLIAYCGATVLGAEDAVDGVACECVGHDCIVPTGLPFKSMRPSAEALG